MGTKLQRALGAPQGPGRVVEDLWRGRLVVLLREGRKHPEKDEARKNEFWLARDLVTDEEYEIHLSRISQDWNSMEALAFVAAASPCACCEADGGRTYMVSAGLLCGACYRNSCDSFGTCRVPNPE